MKRRDLIAVIGCALEWPLALHAQEHRPRRVGVLMGSDQSDSDSQARLEAFRRALREFGRAEGPDLRIDYRWAANDPSRLRTYAAELVGLNPDVVVAHAPPALLAVQQESHTVPIVFVMVPDPVELGVVANLARPGGNVTGFMHVEAAMAGKWLELLKEVSPHINRVAFLLHPQHPGWPAYLRTIEAAGTSFSIDVKPAGVRDAIDLEREIEEFANEQNGGLIVLPDVVTYVHRELIVALAAKHRIPTIYPFRYFPAIGGLMSYGVDPVDLFRRAASYVNRILSGEKPSDLPVQAPTNYQLVVNHKTAKALGLNIPESFLLRADEVIE